jgi:GNAT superfamily N-acetyltransferase
MSPIRIRAATNFDLPALAELWHEKLVILSQSDRRFALMPDDRQQWIAAARGWLDDARCGAFVAAVDDEPVGFIVGWVQPMPPGMTPTQVGMITHLALDAHRYHGGAGRLLLDHARAWFAEQGINQLITWAPHRLPVEQAFWRALGAAEWMDILWIKS